MGENNTRLIFKDYQCFNAIAEEGSISKAAEKLFISQSSVSKYLKRLENNVGYKLFNRESHPITLTEAGELYLKYVKQIYVLEREFRNNATEWEREVRGELKIGIPVFHSSIFFPALFMKFKKNYPQIRIRAYEGSPHEITAMLDQNKIDFAITFRLYDHGNIFFEHLLYERILCIIHTSNPVIHNFHVNLELEIRKISNTDFLRFGREPFVLMKKYHNSRQLVQNYFDKLNFKPNVVLETSNIDTAINLVKTGKVSALIPEMMLRFREQACDIAIFEIDDSVLQREMGIAYKAPHTPTRQQRLFIDLSRELIRDYLK